MRLRVVNVMGKPYLEKVEQVKVVLMRIIAVTREPCVMCCLRK